MKRNMFGALITLIAALTIATPVVYAQKIASADVPSDFCVSGTWLHAGSYEIREMGDSATLMISGDNKGYVLVLNSNAGNNKTGATKLVFHKVADTYFLREIWTRAHDEGLAIRESSLEKEMAASNHELGGGGAEPVIVALR